MLKNDWVALAYLAVSHLLSKNLNIFFGQAGG
ncbi:MAG: hypothetical protein ACJARV_000719 [Candidatus Pseudothioglobus sp.]|jgi:hypothetical protein